MKKSTVGAIIMVTVTILSSISVILLIIFGNYEKESEKGNIEDKFRDVTNGTVYDEETGLYDVYLNDENQSLNDDSILDIDNNDKKEDQELIIIDNMDGMCNNLPTIKINNIVSNLRLIVDATFTNKFKKLYSSYVTAPKYGFALKVYFGDQSNGGYYNVVRSGNNVINKGNFNGFKTGKEINNGVIWNIDLNDRVPFAVANSEYTSTNKVKYLNIGSLFVKDASLKIGVEFSPAGNDKEGCEIIHINQMKLIYNGNEGDIEIK